MVHFHAALITTNRPTTIGIVISSKSLHLIPVSSRSKPIQKYDTGYRRKHLDDKRIFYVNITQEARTPAVFHTVMESAETFSSQSVTRARHALLEH
jgi:hypothetical protein